jgi:hypothetical protein
VGLAPAATGAPDQFSKREVEVQSVLLASVNSDERSNSEIDVCPASIVSGESV